MLRLLHPIIIIIIITILIYLPENLLCNNTDNNEPIKYYVKHFIYDNTTTTHFSRFAVIGPNRFSHWRFSHYSK